MAQAELPTGPLRASIAGKPQGSRPKPEEVASIRDDGEGEARIAAALERNP